MVYLIKLHPMIQITLSEYNALHEDFRGVWDVERDDLPDWPEVRDKYMGKRTMLHYDDGATVLLVEGRDFEIVGDDSPTLSETLEEETA